MHINKIKKTLNILLSFTMMSHGVIWAAPEDEPATSSTSYLQQFQLTRREMTWIYQSVSNFRRLGWTVCWRTVITEFNETFQRKLDPNDALLREKMSQYCFRQARRERLAAQKPEEPRVQLRERIKDAILKFIQEGGKASVGSTTASAAIPWRIIVPKYLPNHEVSDVILVFRSGIQLQRDLLAIISERAEQFPSENWKGWVLSFKNKTGNRKPYEANERTGSAKRRAEQNPVNEEFDHSLPIHLPKRLENEAGCSAPQYTNEELLRGPIPPLSVEEDFDPANAGTGRCDISSSYGYPFNGTNALGLDDNFLFNDENGVTYYSNGDSEEKRVFGL